MCNCVGLRTLAAANARIAPLLEDVPTGYHAAGRAIDTIAARALRWEELLGRQAGAEDALEEALSALFAEQERDVLRALEQHASTIAGRSARRWRAARSLRERRIEENAATALLFDPEEWIEDFMDRYVRTVPDAIRDSIVDSLSDVGLISAFVATDSRLRAFVSKRSRTYAQLVNETTRRAVRSAIAAVAENGESAAQLKERVGVVFSQAKTYRSLGIARTEVNTGTQWGSEVAVAEGQSLLAGSGGEGIFKMWLSQRDSRVRDSHSRADGQVRGPDGYFQVGACQMLHPLDSANCGHAEEIINCRCIISIVRGPAAAAAASQILMGKPVAEQAQVNDALGAAGIQKSENNRPPNITTNNG